MFFPIWGFSTYPWTLPIQSANLAHPYHPSHILSKSSCPYPDISPPPLPHFYRPTPSYLHSYVPHAQTTSIYHSSPPQPRSEHPKDCTNPYCTSLYKYSFIYVKFVYCSRTTVPPRPCSYPIQTRGSTSCCLSRCFTRPAERSVSSVANELKSYQNRQRRNNQ